MRQPQNAKRGRSRGRRGNNNSGHNYVPNRNTSYESNGPDVKLRGNAQQLHEKYMALAHDASTSGERIPAEAFTQFADHYFRLHQAAVGVAETKRQQDNADAAAVAADEPSSVESKVVAESDNKIGVVPVSAKLEVSEADGLATGDSPDVEKAAVAVPKTRPNTGKNKTRASAKFNVEGPKSPSDQLVDTVHSNDESDQPS
jgi:hypothetical protein